MNNNGWVSGSHGCIGDSACGSPLDGAAGAGLSVAAREDIAHPGICGALTAFSTDARRTTLRFILCALDDGWTATAAEVEREAVGTGFTRWARCVRSGAGVCAEQRSGGTFRHRYLFTAFCGCLHFHAAWSPRHFVLKCTGCRYSCSFGTCDIHCTPAQSGSGDRICTLGNALA